MLLLSEAGQRARRLLLHLHRAGAQALDELVFSVRGDDGSLEKTLRNASLLVAAEDEGRTNAHDLVSTALAEYERLLNTLYSEGYYGGVIRIRIDGVEAANIETVDVPDKVSRIDVSVNPATQFRFGTAVVAPLPGRREPVDGFARGEIARGQPSRAAWRGGTGKSGMDRFCQSS